MQCQAHNLLGGGEKKNHLQASRHVMRITNRCVCLCYGGGGGQLEYIWLQLHTCGDSEAPSDQTKAAIASCLLPPQTKMLGTQTQTPSVDFHEFYMQPTANSQHWRVSTRSWTATLKKMTAKTGRSKSLHVLFVQHKPTQASINHPNGSALQSFCVIFT